MKIAVSGTHSTGKTTLVEELCRALPSYDAVDEPYYFLEDEGHEFSEMPSLDDFELQLDRSIESIIAIQKDTIFDRCPADFLAYLFTHHQSANFHVEHWLPRVRRAMELLDLVVFVRVEAPDRLMIVESEDLGFRQRVDEELRKILIEDPWRFAVNVLEVSGTSAERTLQVLVHLKAADV